MVIKSDILPWGPLLNIYKIIYGVSSITIFLSQVRWFANDLHECHSHEWKSLTNHHMSDQKFLFMATHMLFYFLHALIQSTTQGNGKNCHRPITCLQWVCLLWYCDITLWLPAWWALWLPWWPPAGCHNALMYLLIVTMNFCYCFIVVFCWK